MVLHTDNHSCLVWCQVEKMLTEHGKIEEFFMVTGDDDGC